MRRCSCGSVVEHCVSSAKVVGSIPREHMYWQNMYNLNALHCKSLWIKASAKCVNVNVMYHPVKVYLVILSIWLHTIDSSRLLAGWITTCSEALVVSVWDVAESEGLNKSAVMCEWGSDRGERLSLNAAALRRSKNNIQTASHIQRLLLENHSRSLRFI